MEGHYRDRDLSQARCSIQTVVAQPYIHAGLASHAPGNLEIRAVGMKSKFPVRRRAAGIPATALSPVPGQKCKILRILTGRLPLGVPATIGSNSSEANRMRAKPDVSRKAFTLIELLVVMRLSRFSRPCCFRTEQGQQKGKQIACLSNMRQIGMATMMYAPTIGISCHTATPTPGRAKTALVVQDLCRPYIKTEPVYSCPSALPHGTVVDSCAHPDTQDPVKDYLCNARVAPMRPAKAAMVGANGPFINNWMNPSRSMPRSRIRSGLSPSTTAARTSSRSGAWNRWTPVQRRLRSGILWRQPDNKNPTSGHVASRHSSGYNASFSDGHAQFIKKSTLACDEPRWRLTLRSPSTFKVVSDIPGNEWPTPERFQSQR